MSRFSELRDRLQESAPAAVQGHWQAIQMCFDEDANEWLNIGVLFKESSGHTSSRLLDHFGKLQLLYDIDEDELRLTLDDIAAFIASDGEVEGGPIKLTEPLYASGATAQQVVDEFYDDVVTLGRLRSASLRR